MASVTFKKIVEDLSSKKSMKNLVSDFKKLSAELKNKANQIDIKWVDDKTLKQAKAKYRELIKTLNNSQAKIDSEVNNALEMIRSSASELEKNIITYKKSALAQKAKLEKMFSKKVLSKKVSLKKSKKRMSKKASVKKDGALHQGSKKN